MNCPKCNNPMQYNGNYTTKAGLVNIYYRCGVCYPHRKKPRPVPVFEPNEPDLIENMYQGEHKPSEPRLDKHTRQWRHKKYVKCHRRVQAEFHAITKAGLDIDKVGECDKIDAWKKENGYD